jgi:hypothetical protein
VVLKEEHGRHHSDHQTTNTHNLHNGTIAQCQFDDGSMSIGYTMAQWDDGEECVGWVRWSKMDPGPGLNTPEH